MKSREGRISVLASDSDQARQMMLSILENRSLAEDYTFAQGFSLQETLDNNYKVTCNGVEYTSLGVMLDKAVINKSQQSIFYTSALDG